MNAVSPEKDFRTHEHFEVGQIIAFIRKPSSGYRYFYYLQEYQ